MRATLNRPWLIVTRVRSFDGRSESVSRGGLAFVHPGRQVDKHRILAGSRKVAYSWARYRIRLESPFSTECLTN